MHATSSPKLVLQQPAPAIALLAAILFAAGIALGAAMDLDLRIAPAAATVTAPDTSYDAVENARARARFGVESSLAGKSGFPSSQSQDDDLLPATATQPERNGRYGAGYR